MNEYFTSVSISELQQWLADDELPVLSDRLTHSREHLNTVSSGFAVERLINCLPAFSLDDPAGVLIVEVKGPPSAWRAGDELGIYYLALSDVKRFIPLTEDAKAALAVNWSAGIKLSPAIFEHKFTLFRLKRKKFSSQNAGNRFANLLIDFGSESFSADSLFVDSLPRALMAAEHRKPGEIEQIFFGQADKPLETWVERAFGYTRRMPIDKPVNLRSIIDVGLLLKDAGTVEKETDALRAILKEIDRSANGRDESLTFFCANPRLSELEVCFYVNPTSSESISLVTLALFFRWKQAFHDHRSTVDVLSILNDVTSLVGVVDVKQVANGLWMMGAYLGMEHIAPLYRHLNQDKFPALQFVSKEEIFEPARAWQLTELGPSTEHVFVPDSGQEFGAIKTSDHEQVLATRTDLYAEQQAEWQEKKDVLEVKPSESTQERSHDRTEQKIETSESSGFSSSSHLDAVQHQAQAQQAEQVPQEDSGVNGQSEPATKIDSASVAVDVSAFEGVNQSEAESNQGAGQIQKNESSGADSEPGERSVVSPKEGPEKNSPHEQTVAKKQTIATKGAAKPAKKAAKKAVKKAVKKTATKGSSGVTKNVVPSSSVKDDDSSAETKMGKDELRAQGEADETGQQNLL